MLSQEKNISVVIPVYNAENYISRCLNSIISCNYKNLEIICVNDGSFDNSIKIIREFEKKDSRVKTVNKENGGLSSARNAGISIAKGEYVSFIDADDWIHPDYFNILVKHISAEIDAVICGFKQVTEYSAEFAEYDNKKIESELRDVSSDILFQEKELEMFKVYSCGVLYKKEKIYDFFPQGIKVIEDNIFNLLNLPLYNRIVIINLPIYFYYVNQQSIMHTYRSDDAFNGLVWLCKWLDEKRNICEKQKKLIVEFIYKRSFYYRYVFTYLGFAGEKSKYLDVIYKSLERHDNCLNPIRKYIFRFFKKSAFCYRMIKFIRGYRIRQNSIFSVAPNKLIESSKRNKNENK